MPCPTCDHTMHLVVTKEQSGTRDIWWCPRCGTWKDQTPSAASVPKLVERCRTFAARMVEHDFIEAASSVLVEAEWMTCGIAESINLPADRPA